MHRHVGGALESVAITAEAEAGGPRSMLPPLRPERALGVRGPGACLHPAAALSAMGVRFVLER